MSAGGYQTPGGPGNGTPPRRNSVSVSENYRNDCRELEDRYPRLRDTQFFSRLETYMIVCEVEDDARFISGLTWIVSTPEDMDPVLTIYFTYIGGQVTLQEVIDG